MLEWLKKLFSRKEVPSASEKSMETVYIPAGNEEDLRNVPDEVRKALTIVPVRTARDVLTALSILPQNREAVAV